MSRWLVSGREHSGKGWSGACYADSREQALRDAFRLANDPQAWRETRVDELPIPGNGARYDAPAMFTEPQVLTSDPHDDRPTRSEQSLEGAAVNGLTPVGQEASYRNG